MMYVLFVIGSKNTALNSPVHPGINSIAFVVVVVVGLCGPVATTGSVGLGTSFAPIKMMDVLIS